ncbi:MAG: ATP:cob(I)alamin adenosyltransferase, partial [Planctomycetes bacterium]|nr:ATP:cob(I)alamin adenosyltransferase [Planctomycetota bacterium]
MKPDMGAGDGGATGLPGGRRVPKDSPQIEALGAIDEASAAVGLARSLIEDNNRRQVLFSCQQALQQAAAVVASAESKNAGAATFDFVGAVAAGEEEMSRLSQ